jgi:TPR repeat protein
MRRARLLGLLAGLAAAIGPGAPAAAGTIPTPTPSPRADGAAAERPAAATPDSASPDPGQPATSAPAPDRFGDEPANSAPSADTPDPNRFGGKPADAAYGAYQRGLYVTAYNLALPRARNGDAAAQALVAEILARGLGVPRNPVEAAKWYSLAAEQGVPEAQFQYALMLLDGTYVKKDVNGAYALLEAAAQAGNVLAEFNFAQLIVDREPGEAGMTKAVAYYEMAAKAGLADAQYAMSQICAQGVGGRKRDEAEARNWLTLAAKQGYDTAELDLGSWLIEGRGGPKDAKAGFGWLRRAALGGNVAAQNRLAKLYMQGIGVDPDTIMAAAWYIVAHRAGLSDPQMDDLLRGLTPEETKQAIEKANRLR